MGLRKLKASEALSMGLLHGPKGDVGPKGERGPQGLTGPQGPSGANGRDGRDGKDGKDGITTTVTKEVAVDLEPLKAELESVRKELKSVKSSGGQGGYFPGGKYQPDMYVTGSDISLGPNDAIVVRTVDSTVTLPAKPRQEQRVTIKQGGTDVDITINGNGQSIDGAATQCIQAIESTDNIYTGMQLVYLGNQWWIV